MDKHLAIKLNASRKVTGILRGYDQFMNMVRGNGANSVTYSRHLK